MGLTRTDLYTEAQNKIAAVAKVLGHPARIAILQELIAKQSCVCGDLVDQIGLAQATISQHLRELKKIGLIKGEIDGVRVCYCIDANTWKEIAELIQKFMDQPVILNNCC